MSDEKEPAEEKAEEETKEKAEDKTVPKYRFKCLEQKCTTRDCHIRPHVNVTFGDLSRWTVQGYIANIIGGLEIIPPEKETDSMTIETKRKPLKVESEGSACIFFDEDANGCIIRYARPISCRTFPLEYNGTKYYLSSKDCPGVGQGEVTKDGLKDAKELAEQDYKERVETITTLPAAYSLVIEPMIRQSAEAMERMSEDDRKQMEELLSRTRDVSPDSDKDSD
ncbi:MAG: YkgJ family cysteine cluster protein [Candidatus Thorarchaeota archaeon]